MKSAAAARKGEITIFLVPEKSYPSKMKEVVSSLSSDCRRICYVSLNKPYSELVAAIKSYRADPENFFFIDCTGSGKEKEGRAVFVSSQKAIGEMSVAISKALEQEMDALILDSLSTLLAYHDRFTVVRFMHSLVSMIRAKKVTGILVCLEGRENVEVVKDVSMFADRAVTAYPSKIQRTA